MNTDAMLDIYADAGFYDLEFATRTHEIAFFMERGLACQGHVLEIACGTGRLTLPLAGAGIPRSAPMA